MIGPDFAAAARPENRLRTILEQAEERGMWTGVVSTARLTHATPAACYAHTPARDAEDDTDLAGISRAAAEAGYPDIARQLLDFRVKPTTMNGHASPGLEVAMGGGRSKFLRITDADPEYPAEKGTRNDRDLAAAWAARGGSMCGTRRTSPRSIPRRPVPCSASSSRRTCSTSSTGRKTPAASRR